MDLQILRTWGESESERERERERERKVRKLYGV